MSSFKVGDWVKVVEPKKIAAAISMWSQRNPGVVFDYVTGTQGVVVTVDDGVGVFFPLMSSQITFTEREVATTLEATVPHPDVDALWQKVSTQIIGDQKMLEALREEISRQLRESRAAGAINVDAFSKKIPGVKSVSVVVPDAEGPLYDDGFDEPGENESDDSEPAELFLSDTQPQTAGESATHEPRRPAVVTDSMRMLDMLHSMRLSATQVAYQMYMQRLSREDDSTGDGDMRALQVRLTDEEEQLRNTAASVVRRYLAVNSLKDEDLRIR
jgi:hypothetical protein